MKLYNIVSTINLSTLAGEFFILPSFVEQQNVEAVLSTMRNQTRGYWKREKRQVLYMTGYDSKEDQSTEVKYIVVDMNGQPTMLLFSKNINHDSFFECVSDLLGEYCPVLSAGFTNRKTCYGRSETLNLDSNPELDLACLQLVL